MSLALVHLVRATNGFAPVKAFLNAYRAHAPGFPHQLVIACKGMVDDLELEWFLPLWKDLPARVISLPDDGPGGSDMESYRAVADRLGESYVCFANSFARPIADGWLRDLYDAAVQPDTGLIGATGSLEIAPHVRTNVFCMARELFLSVLPNVPLRRADALALEAGPDSLSARVQALNLRCLVVGKGGRGGDIAATRREDRIFRWGDQEGLLVADNRTDDYANTNKAGRAFLQTIAWQETQSDAVLSLRTPSGALSRDEPDVPS